MPSWDPPPYAILSHTWGAPEDEVLFEDFVNGTLKPEAKAKSAFFKVCYACKQAKADDLEYCWIDTCCIDKSSSAELQESINSMFSWYEKAVCCYAYLSDVERGMDGSEFAKSRWFTRGWTLQELLAPYEVVFYTRDWDLLAKKNTIPELLREITGIAAEILSGEHPIDSASVAQRMSWASGRKTSRPEDISYCLLGIFNVNMPMLYGEGKKAFRRLQEEIIKSSYDHVTPPVMLSTPLWYCPSDNPTPNAPEPVYFSASGGEREWSIIGWTKTWNPEQKRALDVITLSGEAKRPFDIWLGLSCNGWKRFDEAFRASGGAFWVLNEPEANLTKSAFELNARRTGQIQSIEDLSFGVSCAKDLTHGGPGTVFFVACTKDAGIRF
ncbi:MAG: hypothetical protein Q9227_003635 [Pyrenula ochraceoflavens]